MAEQFGGWNKLGSSLRHTAKPMPYTHSLTEMTASAAVAEETPADPTPAWFMDTRDTAVTKLAEAGCTIPEICAITGHDEESAYKVLKHYLALNGSMADAAIAKFVAFEERKRAGTGTSH